MRISRTFRARRPRAVGPLLVASALVAGLASVVLTAGGSGAVGGSPSGFESADGNMTVETAGNTDWNCFTSLSGINKGAACNSALATSNFKAVNESSGDPTGDQQWTSGQKQDTACPTLTPGTAPSKDNFTYVASYSEVATSGSASGDAFLYGATTRSSANGNASENVELNQLKTTCTNGSPMPRTPGDKLIAINYLGGGSSVSFAVLTWVTTGACDLSHDKAPCWGPSQPLGSSSADGSTNTPAIVAADNGLSNVDLVSNQFAEFGIDLTAAGIVQAGACNPFAQGVFESRSSGSSFSSNPEDIEFVAHPFTTCGSINIHKQDDTGAAMSGVAFTLYSDASPLSVVAGGTQTAHGNEDTATTKTCSTNASGDCTMSSVPFGNYWIVETTAPVGFTPAADQAVVVGPGGNTPSGTFTFTDTREPATLKLHKQDDLGNPLAGAGFTLYSDSSPFGPNAVTPGTQTSHGTEDLATSFTCTTDAAGNCTISNILPPGSYWVVETTVPTGYTGAADYSIKLALNQTLDLSSSHPFVDPRQPATLTLHKQDDLGAPLSGAGFTLYSDSSPFGPNAVTPGTQTSHGTEDLATSFTCTTDAAGNCTISNILPPGSYWVVETTIPTGYAAAADYSIKLALNQTLDLSSSHPFVDQRLFKIITLVCQESNNSLYSAKVGYGAEGSTTVPSLPGTNNTATSLSGVSSAATLCSSTTAGADPDVHIGNYPTQVGIG